MGGRHRGARRQARAHDRLVLVAAENEDAGGRARLPELLKDFQPAGAGQAEVEDEQLRFQPEAFLHRHGAVGGFAHDLVFRQHPEVVAQQLADRNVILREINGDRFGGVAGGHGIEESLTGPAPASRPETRRL